MWELEPRGARRVHVSESGEVAEDCRLGREPNASVTQGQSLQKKRENKKHRKNRIGVYII